MAAVMDPKTKGIVGLLGCFRPMYVQGPNSNGTATEYHPVFYLQLYAVVHGVDPQFSKYAVRSPVSRVIAAY